MFAVFSVFFISCAFSKFFAIFHMPDLSAGKFPWELAII